MSDNPLTEPFDRFIENISDHNADDKLLFTAGIVELLRHAKSSKVETSLAELLVSLPVVEWSKIPFSITKALLSTRAKNMVVSLGVPHDLVTDALLSGFLIFLSRFNDSPRTEDALFDAIKDVAEAIGSEYKPPKPAPTTTPELFNHRLVQRVFEPANVTDDVLSKLDAKLVYYSAPVSTGKLGPEIRGLAFDNGTNRYFILLESGEFVTVPKDYEHLRLVNCSVLFPGVPTALFLALGVAAPLLETYAVISKEQLAFILAGNLGKPTKPLYGGVTAVDDINALERAFDIGRESAMLGFTGATGPSGATVRFPIPETDTVVVLTASQDAYGPYSTARLVREDDKGNETILMRHETPRLYSLRGVYLFPLKDQLISLVSIF